MKTRILFLVAVGLLSGCASSGMYWGPALLTYGTGSAETFASGGSRNGAEYHTARKKLKNAHGQTTTDARSDVDELEEIEVRTSPKIGIP